MTVYPCKISLCMDVCRRSMETKKCNEKETADSSIRNSKSPRNWWLRQMCTGEYVQIGMDVVNTMG